MNREVVLLSQSLPATREETETARVRRQRRKRVSSGEQQLSGKRLEPGQCKRTVAEITP